MLRDLAPRLGSPDRLRGALAIWSGLAGTCLALSAMTVSECPIWERVAFSAILTTPVLLLARQGHFGQGSWRFPSIASQIYLVWTWGLLPSLAAAQSPDIGLYFYQPVAKLVGCLVFLLWFIAFAFSAGRASGSSPTASTEPGRTLSRFDRWAFALFFLGWLIPYGMTASQGMLSSWGQRVNMEEVAGTSEGVPLLLYNAFVSLLPLLSYWAWLNSARKWKAFFAILMGFSVLALMLYSNRRITLVTFFVGLFLLQQTGRRVHWKGLAFGALGIALMMGPLLWPLRMATHNPELFMAQEDTFALAKEAIGRYFTDPEFRQLADLAGKENLQSGRFNYADTFLATVQWNLDHGFRHSPSFLFAPIKMIPSSLWPAKNDVAVAFNIKSQFNDLGISDQPDFPMTPMQEAFFQYGYLGALLGGLFWGWMARLLTRGLDRAAKSFEGMLVWLAFLLGAMSFEGFFTMFLPIAREPVVLAGLLMAIRFIGPRIRGGVKGPQSQLAASVREP